MIQYIVVLLFSLSIFWPGSGHHRHKIRTQAYKKCPIYKESRVPQY